MPSRRPPALESRAHAAPHLHEVGAHGPRGGARAVPRICVVRRRRDGKPAVGHGALLPAQHRRRHGRAARQRDSRAALRYRAVDDHHAARGVDDHRVRRHRGAVPQDARARVRPVHQGRARVRPDPGDRRERSPGRLEQPHAAGNRAPGFAQGLAARVSVRARSLVPASDVGHARPITGRIRRTTTSASRCRCTTSSTTIASSAWCTA